MSIIYLVHGDKGGVGKSTLAITMGDFLLRKNKKFTLIEGDSRNPDVSRIFNNEDKVNTYELNLREKEGWYEFVDALEEVEKDNPILVSLPAGAGSALHENIKVFSRIAKQQQWSIVLVWVISRSKDSVILLKHTLKEISNFIDDFYVVRNNFFGSAEKFVIFNESETRKDFESLGGTIVDFPELDDRIVDAMYTENTRFSELTDKLQKLSMKAVLAEWVEDTDKVVENIFA